MTRPDKRAARLGDGVDWRGMAYYGGTREARSAAARVVRVVRVPILPRLGHMAHLHATFPRRYLLSVPRQHGRSEVLARATEFAAAVEVARQGLTAAQWDRAKRLSLTTALDLGQAARRVKAEALS